MECAHCGDEAFNRLIINPTTGEERGGLCEDCEVTKFGVLTSEPLWHQPDGCGMCPRAADVSLPEVDCLIEWDDGSEEIEYSDDDTTLQLCIHHLTEIIDIEEPVSVDPVKTRA